ncbi:hypothetical protein GCM10010357_49240 [Streptomyces luteireticuli]|uniref:Uncharacterized protein n=1 Tax=Streptomyces luteireticuli TaxID=173858 RepID=A0ABP3ISP1_9ACTN
MIFAAAYHASSPATLAAVAHAEEWEWLMMGDGGTESAIGLLWGRADRSSPVISPDVHCASPDGRAYVGFLPEAPSVSYRGFVWRVSAWRPRAGARLWLGCPSRP